MATAKEKRIVEFYKKKYKETGNPVYLKVAEYWGKRFGVEAKSEEKKGGE